MNQKKAIKRFSVMAAAAVMALAAAMVTWAATRLETVSDTYWDENNITIAVWEEVEDADQYLVYLYRNESKVAEIKTKKIRYEFEKKMTAEGEYSFRVKALGRGSKYSDSVWSEYSDTTYISESYAEFLRNGGKIDTQNSGPGAASGAQQTTGAVSTISPWIQNEKGWWYRNVDGSYPMNAWFQDPANGKWYLFNQEGYMMTGWITWNNESYYCGADGAMVTGTVAVGEVTYQFDETGRLLSTQ